RGWHRPNWHARDVRSPRSRPHRDRSTSGRVDGRFSSGDSRAERARIVVCRPFSSGALTPSRPLEVGGDPRRGPRETAHAHRSISFVNGRPQCGQPPNKRRRTAPIGTVVLSGLRSLGGTGMVSVALELGSPPPAADPQQAVTIPLVG